MRSEDLIQSLSADTRAISPHALQQRVLLGLLGGGIAALALMVPWMGFRPDLPGAMMTTAFVMKWAYTISLGVLALVATLHVARPDAGPMRLAWLIVVPFVLLAITSAVELIDTPVDGWMPMWLGHSWRECSARVAVLSLPVFGGLLWAFRTLAPTRLVSAGAAAGLASGACAATIYGLHCPEVSATFVLTWYSLGMVVAAGVGALVGPRLLRW
ncbi:DUF1109 domain-containing protein [Sphingomonas sp. 28-63-12]|uniref:DUF1109 domain-containing protein n=1 Tax=Sphingomonas sp. 28-63-12 TaxID=1970434 RepID=UPI000BD9FACD|nr:MAG: hypothetical protein B7Y47_05330 [Sphingomonas sp. 28-63-12]